MEKNYYERLSNEELRVKNIAYRKEVPQRPIGGGGGDEDVVISDETIDEICV